MKKLKQALLADLSRQTTTPKLAPHKKTGTTDKNKLHTKKKNNENTPLEIKHVEETKLKSYRTPLNSAKLNQQKKNKRSKSMLHDKKTRNKIETTHNSSDLAVHLNQIRLEQPTYIDEVSTIVHTNCLKANCLGRQQTFEDFSPQKAVEKRDCSTQARQILIEDAEIQCEEFQLQELIKHRARCQQIEKQKQQLDSKVLYLSNKMETALIEAQRREKIINKRHAEQTNILKQKIQQLTQINLSLSKQKSQLIQIIQEKQANIKQLSETKEKLEIRLSREQAAKEEAIKAKEALQNQILFYKEEVVSFEQSLSEFIKMKNMYEKRLDSLQMQKLRIKRHAQDLLELVEEYKQKSAVEND